MTGFEPGIVLNAIAAVMREFAVERLTAHLPPDYTIVDTSWRVLKLILGNAKLSNG